MRGLSDMAGSQSKECAVNLPRMMTVREGLIERKTRLEEQLAEVNAALEFMDKNANFEQFYNVMRRAGF